jgi:hypothetical protein
MTMRWSPSMMSKLSQVREVRMRLAEMDLVRADEALAQSKQAEEAARTALVDTTERSAEQTAQADRALVTTVSGGRRGITEWQGARKRAQAAIETARGKVDDAVSARVGKELESSTARGRWRETRYELERLRLLAEQMSSGSAG